MSLSATGLQTEMVRVHRYRVMQLSASMCASLSLTKWRQLVPHVPASGVARVELVCLQNGQIVENVFHVRVAASGPLTEAQLDTVKATFEAWRVASLRAQQGAGLTYLRWQLRDMTTAFGVGKVYPITANTAGGAAAALMPGNVTVAIKWSSGFTGRSRRGRTFHLGVVTTQVLGNQLAGAGATNLQTVYAALLSACTTAGHPLVVYSRVEGGVYRTDALITPISSASVDPNLDSMRRRLTGEGRGN